MRQSSVATGTKTAKVLAAQLGKTFTACGREQIVFAINHILESTDWTTQFTFRTMRDQRYSVGVCIHASHLACRGVSRNLAIEKAE